MKHSFYKLGDKEHDCAQERDVPHFCMVCELACCKVCGGAEGSLTEDCPGERMTEHQEQDVLRGVLNFANNRGWYHI
jgi:hypothetical protein